MHEQIRVKPDTEKLLRETNTRSLQTVKIMHKLNAPPPQPLYAHAFTTGDVYNLALPATEFSQFNVWAANHFGTPEGHGWAVVPFWWPRHTGPSKSTVVLLAIVVSGDQQKMTMVPLFGYDRV